jgi:hypothetical protein
MLVVHIGCTNICCCSNVPLLAPVQADCIPQATTLISIAMMHNAQVSRAARVSSAAANVLPVPAATCLLFYHYHSQHDDQHQL